jgi:hypothetical protein
MIVSQEGNNNVYIVWWTNRSGNREGMFRASTDGGQTFGDKINLSNPPDFSITLQMTSQDRLNQY